MAKSSRSSTKKANNQRKVAGIFGPAEAARNERLSARLLEIAQQPKPESSDVNMDAQPEAEEDQQAEKTKGDETKMEVDGVKPSRGRIEKRRIDKRKVKKSGIVFRKYGDKVGSKKKKKTTS